MQTEFIARTLEGQQLAIVFSWKCSHFMEDKETKYNIMFECRS